MAKSQITKSLLVVFMVPLLVIAAIAIPSASVKAAFTNSDINSDGKVNVVDLSLLLAAYGQEGAQIANPACDINSDGSVNILDLSTLLTNFGLAQGAVVWKADATSATEEEWSAWSDDAITGAAPSPDGGLYQNWAHPDIQRVTQLGTVLPGKPAYRVFAPVGEGRHELKMAHPIRSGFNNRIFRDGDETWISWATKMTLYTRPTSGQWMINQFRHVNETGLTTGGSPHGLAVRNSPNYQWVSDPNIYAGAITPYDLGVPVVLNQTIKWTFHVKWSSARNTGFMEVFADDGAGWKLVMPRRYQATLLFNSTSGLPGTNHMRFGIYRSSSDSSIDNSPGETYMAGLSAATTREAAEAAAFGN